MAGFWVGPVCFGVGAVLCGWMSVHNGSSAASRSLLVPTAIQWKRPVGDLQELQVLAGDVFSARVMNRHAALPVVSVVATYDDLFGAERGIYGIGNALLHDQDNIALKYLREPRWWKYPGNYLFRGKEWERDANIEVFGPDGERLCNEQVGIRINGNTTRGFPQKALRVLFNGDRPMRLFANEARPYSEIVLRASGNDQDRTMFRDAVQHRLCEGMAFDVSRAVQSVVYINGAYWGIHNIRERLEDDELAIRHGLKKKSIVILADRALSYRGDDQGVEARRFSRWLNRLERMEPSAQAFTDSVEAAIDVENFLQYMAAQIIFGNTDWPDQNVKYWRWTGARDSTNAKTDGRWRFVMGDSDLSFGYQSGAVDLFAHLDRKQGPVARLFRASMRSPVLRDRFGRTLMATLDGPLSASTMVSEVERMAANIDAEMHRHINRWRRPSDHAAWQGHVQQMVTFARNRPQEVRAQWAERSARSRP